MEYKLRKAFRHGSAVLLRICLILLVLFLLGGSLYAGLDPRDGRIADNVTVGGIDVGGMTPERAYRELKYAAEE